MVEAKWQKVETTLYIKGKEAIERFAREEPDLVCSFFAYYADPIAGEFAICIDTQEHAWQLAREAELQARQRRERFLEEQSAWPVSAYYLEHPTLLDYSSSTDDFHFSEYIYFSFADWGTLFDNEENQKRQPPVGERDYLEGNTRYLIWKTLERFVAEGAFAQLKTAPLFRLGYHFDEQNLLVLRILNWPLPAEE